jgi:hypothetical protein
MFPKCYVGSIARQIKRIGILSLIAIPLAAQASANPVVSVSMTSDRWLANGTLTFLKQTGYPQGLMKVQGHGALLKDLEFSNGTIEYDINEDGDMEETSGIWFREQNAATAENFYLRPFANCEQTRECMQYGPVRRGRVQWDVYPEYEAAGPIKLKGWNHVKLVISGRRMNAFINGSAQPSLEVGCLAGEADTGSIQLRGNATYANLTIAPGVVDGLPPEAAADPSSQDGRYLRHWRLSPIKSLPGGASPDYGSMPTQSASWEHLDAERKGFVNISRNHGTEDDQPDLAWLKTTIISRGRQVKHVDMGWVRQIWVYANDRLVFSGNNLYYPASAERPPLGRMSLENGAFDLPLEPGVNRIVVATSDMLSIPADHHWGWGFEFWLGDVDGVTLSVGGKNK